MLATDIPYPIGIGATTIKMNNHDGAGARGDGCLYQRIVNLQGIDGWLYQYGGESALCDGEDRCDIGVGRHDDLVALLYNAQFDVGTKDKRKRIETIGATYTILCANILSIVLFKLASGFTFQIPATIQYTTDSRTNLCIVQLVDSLQIEILYHRLY